MATTIVNNFITNRSLFLRPVTNAAFVDSATPIVSSFGSVGTEANKWYGGCLAPNGRIYCVPQNENRILVINPSNDTFYYIEGIPSGAEKYRGSVLAPNGKIYCFPATRRSVLVINPSNDTFYEISLNHISGWSNSEINYQRGTLAPNGRIYVNPAAANFILKINTATDTASTIGGNLGPQTFKYGSSALSVDGKVVMNPSFAITPLLVDPLTDSVTNFADSVATTNKSYSCILGRDGLMYAIPWGDSVMRVLNPTTLSYSTLFTGLSGGIALGGVMGVNGLLYAAPGNTERVLEVNPYIPSWRYVGASLGTASVKFSGSVMARNGDIYGIPRDASSICKIGFGLSNVSDYLVSAYVNN